ncbi:MAG: hypothetical protein ACYDHY_19895 [Acidiferrobacterales bacterium]
MTILLSRYEKQFTRLSLTHGRNDDPRYRYCRHNSRGPMITITTYPVYPTGNNDYFVARAFHAGKYFNAFAATRLQAFIHVLNQIMKV